MLKWTSKGFLHSEDKVSSALPSAATLPWHKPDGYYENTFLRQEAAKRLLTGNDKTFAQFESKKDWTIKRVLTSEPNSPRGSAEDLRRFHSSSLPSSPMAKKKNKNGVFKRLRNMFRKSKPEYHDILSHDFFLTKNNAKANSNISINELRGKKNKSGKRGIPKTRLARLIETKRKQRKMSQSTGEYKQNFGESRSFTALSTSSDDEGNFLRTSSQILLSQSPLSTFMSPNLNSFVHGDGDVALEVGHCNNRFTETQQKSSKMTLTVPIRNEEPNYVTRIVPRFMDEENTATISLLNHQSYKRNEKLKDQIIEDSNVVLSDLFLHEDEHKINTPLNQDAVARKIATNVDSIILERDEYGLVKSFKPQKPNGFKKPSKKIVIDNEEDVSVSSESIQDYIRSLHTIKESGSLEKVKVIMSSPEALIQARAMLHSLEEHQAFFTNSKSTESFRISTNALCDNRDDQWSLQDDDQTLYSNHDSSIDEFFYKAEEEIKKECNEKNCPCTRNNNNGHHDAPLTIPRPLYDMPGEHNNTILKASNCFKPGSHSESLDIVGCNKLDYSQSNFVLNVEKTELQETITRRAKSDHTLNEKSETDSSSYLQNKHQSLLAIRPKKVKDIVEYLERESLSRCSPTEKTTERLIKDVETMKPRNQDNNMVSSKHSVTLDTFSVTNNHQSEDNKAKISEVERAVKRDHSFEYDFSFTLDEENFSRCDHAEQDLISLESSAFHVSDQMAEDINTYVSDTKAYCSDNTEDLTSTASSKEDQGFEQDLKLVPVVHLICDKMLNFQFSEPTSEKDYSAKMLSSTNYLQSEDVGEISEDDKNSIMSVEESEESFMKENNQEYPGDFFENNTYCQINEQENLESNDSKPLSKRTERKFFVDDREDEKSFYAVISGSENEEGITDVIAPMLMTITDLSGQDNISENYEMITTDGDSNLLSANSNSCAVNSSDKNIVQFSTITKQDSFSRVNNDIFYMPECALEEFDEVNDMENTSKELKFKKKVSFNLELLPTESASFSDDKAVYETTLHNQQSSAQLRGQVSNATVASSTDVSVTDLSVESAVIQNALTLPVTSNSGDDISWWGTEKIEDIDFFHDQTLHEDKNKKLSQNTDNASYTAVDKHVQGNLHFDEVNQPQEVIEEDVCGTSKILIDKVQELSNDNSQGTYDDKSWLQSEACAGDRSVNKKNECLEDKEYDEENPKREMCYDYGVLNREIYFDEARINKESSYEGTKLNRELSYEDTTLNRESSYEDAIINRESSYEDAMLNRKSSYEDTKLNRELNYEDNVLAREFTCEKNLELIDTSTGDLDEQPDLDLTSDINTHTYNVVREQAPADFRKWWNKCSTSLSPESPVKHSPTSPTNLSLKSPINFSYICPASPTCPTYISSASFNKLSGSSPGNLSSLGHVNLKITSPTNDSFGSFEIDSQDDSNTLTDLYNQLKKPAVTTKPSIKPKRKITEKTKKSLSPNLIQWNKFKNDSPKNKVIKNVSEDSKENKRKDQENHVKNQFKKQHSSDRKEKTKIDQGVLPMTLTESPNSKDLKMSNKLRKTDYTIKITENSHPPLNSNEADRRDISYKYLSTPTRQSNHHQQPTEQKAEISEIKAFSYISRTPTKVYKRPEIEQNYTKRDGDATTKICHKKLYKNHTLWTKARCTNTFSPNECSYVLDDNTYSKMYDSNAPTEAVSRTNYSLSETSLDSCSCDKCPYTYTCSDSLDTSTGNKVPNSELRQPMIQKKTQFTSFDHRIVDRIIKYPKNSMLGYLPSHLPKNENMVNLKANQNELELNHINRMRGIQSTKNEFISRSEHNDFIESGKSLTNAVAERDSTTATSIVSSRKSVLVTSQEPSVWKNRAHACNTPMSDPNSRAKQQTTFTNITKKQTNGAQGIGYQQVAGHQSDGLNQAELSCINAYEEGDLLGRERRKSPGPSPFDRATCIQEETSVQRQPGEWLFIASFFVFQLFMHWVYAIHKIKEN